MTVTMEPRFAAALRGELVRRARTGRGSRRRAFLIGAGVAVGVGFSAAAVGDQLLHPGVNEIELAQPVVATYTGSADVRLGPRPDDASNVRITITCLTAGRLDFEDGAYAVCGPGDETGYTIGLPAGAEAIHVAADDGLVWRVTASYQLRVVEPFAVNENGDSYGSPNEVYGDPDLILVEATNGELGYVYADDLENAFGPRPSSPEEAVIYTERNEGQSVLVPVYAADGDTQVGEFRVGG